MTSTLIDRRNGIAEGLAMKVPCRVATTGNIALAGLQVIDTVQLVDGDRVLVREQTDAVDNGPYDVSSGNWTRTADFDGARDIVKGTRILITDGATYGGDEFVVDTDNPIVIGTSEIEFIEGVASGASIQAAADAAAAATAIAVGLHPLNINRKYFKTVLGAHLWNGPGGYDPASRVYFQWYTINTRHGSSPGAALWLATSLDGWETIETDRVVYTETGFEAQASFGSGGVMANGRWGIVFLLRNIDSSTYKNVFWKTDDQGATGTARDITADLDQAFTPVGAMHPLLTAEGGADSGGYAFFGSAANKLFRAKTLDNGDTITGGIVQASSIETTEPSVIKVGINKFIALMRDGSGFSDQTQALNAWGMVSSNGGASFSTPIDSGLLLGSNPITLIADGAIAFAYACMRGKIVGVAGYGTPTGFEDTLVYATDTMANVFANGGAFVGTSAWINAGAAPARFVGSFYYWRDAGGRLMASACGAAKATRNADPVGPQAIILFATPHLTMASTLPARPQRNLLDNAFFRDYAGVIPSDPITSGRAVDRWFWNGPGSVEATVSIVSLSDETRMALPFRPDRGLSIVSDGVTFAELYLTFYGRDWVRRICDGTAAFQLVGIGSMPLCSWQIRVNCGTGGSAAPPAGGAVFAPFDSGAGYWWQKLRGETPIIDGLTITEDATITISIKALTGDPWDVVLIAAKMELGEYHTDIELVTPEDERLVMKRYLNVLSYPPDKYVTTVIGAGTDVAVGPIDFGIEMVKQPSSAVVLDLTASDFYYNSNSTPSDNNTTLDGVHAKGGRIAVRGLSGIDFGDMGSLYANTATKKIMVDTGL